MKLILNSIDAQCTPVVRTVSGDIMKSKNDRVYIRLSSEIKDDFKVVSKLRGLAPSSLIHSLIVKAIREEKTREPQAFEEVVPAQLVGQIHEKEVSNNQ